MTLPHRFADTMLAAAGTLNHVMRYAQFAFDMQADPALSNFAFGNPNEMPLAEFVQALQKWTPPRHKDWFSYKTSEPSAQAAVAADLRDWRGVVYEDADILLTNGAFAALSVSIKTLASAGDEVIFISPPWFFYESMIAAASARPVRVRIDSQTYDLDLNAIEAAITPRTRAIIINSPNNPTGRIYPPETLRALAGILTKASERAGRPVYLISDESYSRIVFDGITFHSPTEYYPYSLLIYTYGKTLLIPGQRVGYIALPPAMPDRETMRQMLMLSQMIIAWAFPNALLQYALPEITGLSIDIGHLQDKRDHMLGALREMGYDIHTPEGTFYLLPRSPIADDWAFMETLLAHQILTLPGTVVEQPGYFRLSLTANDEMIERALPGFEKAIAEHRR